MTKNLPIKGRSTWIITRMKVLGAFVI